MTPANSTLVLGGAWLLVALAASLWPPAAPLWSGCGALLLLLLLIDAVRSRGRAPLEAERHLAGALPLGARSSVRVRLKNRVGRPLRVELWDHTPAELLCRDLPLSATIPARQGAELEYRVRALKRGALSFGPIEYRFASPWHLWWRRVRVPAAREVRVYPNFQTVAKYGLLARANRLGELGIHRQQRRGEGTDFLELREYRVGDTLRQIDWSATAKLQKTISREYHDERDQQIIFMLDHGRSTHSKDGELSHLDHALNALLLLAYVALRQGDAVGLLTFGGESRWVAPGKGTTYTNVILNAVFDLPSTLAVPDVREAAELLMRRVPKRSLVILITNLRDDPGEAFAPVLRLAQRRHMVLLASMRERVLADVLGRPVVTHRDAVTTAAVHRYLREREFAHRRLSRAGIHCLDIEPHRLAPQLVSHYLAIKRAGAL